RASAIIDSITERWQILAAVIDLERVDRDAIVGKHTAFADLLRNQPHAIRRITLAAHANVDVKSFRQVLHHLPRARWPPHRQLRPSLAPRPADPSRKPQIGKTHDVIGMMMRQENAGYFAERNA